jgi:hypothetical protein
MKNIHILPTDNYKNVKLSLFNNNLYLGDFASTAKPQHIYITSDEEIKEGDWYITILENEVYKATKETQNIMSVANLVGSTSYKKTHFKIILTTDQDLIKDGVQAIDDEFLEWFIKNPSCEYVNIEKYHGINTSIAEVNYISGDGSLNWKGRNDLRDYKIIIPKEEPKQEMPIINGSYGCIIETNKQETLEEAANRILSKEGVKLHPSGLETYLKGNVINAMVEMAKWQAKRMENAISKFKQETIEEAANNWIKNTSEFLSVKNGFIEGAKWQAERMYSEVIEFAEWIRIKDFQTASKNNWIGLDMKYYTTQELFEQYKKK